MNVTLTNDDLQMSLTLFYLRHEGIWTFYRIEMSPSKIFISSIKCTTPHDPSFVLYTTTTVCDYTASYTSAICTTLQRVVAYIEKDCVACEKKDAV